ncbi:MAG: signal peptidase I [Anaerolineae bacterium]|nr:signal peptidase I [Anaerolineae bacterium]
MDNRQGQSGVSIENQTPLDASDLEVHSDTLSSRSVLGWAFSAFKELLETIVPALLIAFLVTHFLGERTVVYGQSMEPALYQNQQVIIDKITYRFREPARGDIVIIDIKNSDIPYIKRVVGLPGEVLEVRNNRVYIDGKVLSESYILEINQGDYGPITIPEGHVFVMGDNRRYSRDSRIMGTIPINDIIAKAWFRVWPLKVFGPID